MSYVDGYVLPVKKKHWARYRKMAKLAGKVWMEHGALAYVECVGDDVPVGKLTSFPRSVKQKPDEVVVFAYVVYASRRARDRVNKKVMEDPRMQVTDADKEVADMKRIIYGGFKPFVSLG